MSPADLDAARKAAFDLLDALVRLRNQAKDGALLSPADPLCTERQQRLGELFVRWRRDMAQWWEAEKPRLERVAEAVHVLPGRIVHFGLLRERKALTILARLMDDALAHLADDPVLPGTAEAGQAFCEQLEQKLQQPFQGRVGFWEDLGHSLEEDFDLAAQALRELNPLPATGDEGGATPAQQTDAASDPAAGDHETPPAAPLPGLLSAADLARLLGEPIPRVESFLRRYRQSCPDCYVCVDGDDRRRNQARYLYRTEDVWPALQEQLPRWRRLDGRLSDE